MFLQAFRRTYFYVHVICTSATCWTLDISKRTTGTAQPITSIIADVAPEFVQIFGEEQFLHKQSLEMTGLTKRIVSGREEMFGRCFLWTFFLGRCVRWAWKPFGGLHCLSIWGIQNTELFEWLERLCYGSFSFVSTIYNNRLVNLPSLWLVNLSPLTHPPSPEIRVW